MVHLQSTSPQDWYYILGAGSILILLLLAVEWLRRNNRGSGEVNRKIIHLSTGTLIYSSPMFLESPVPALVLGTFFMVFNAVAIRFQLLKSIHGITRTTYGTIFYPLAFVILILFCWHRDDLAFMSAMGALAFGDAAAGLTGQFLRKPHDYFLTNEKKSLEGSAVMFIVSFLVIGFSFYYVGKASGTPYPWSVIVTVSSCAAAIAVILEALSSRGSDNLSVPMGVALAVHVMTHPEAGQEDRFLLGIMFSSVIVLAAYRFRLLNPSGTAGAWILGIIIFGIGGWSWALPILTFFLTSSILSKLGHSRKHDSESLYEKSGVRDIGQVIANGGLAGVVILLAYFYPNALWYPVFIGTVAGVTADTWATEIGTWFRGSPVSITTLKKVDPGTSGGISWQGTLGGISGAGVVTLSGLAVEPSRFLHPEQLFVLIAAGFVGSLADSILGATLQAQYQCVHCGRTTERIWHCESPSSHTRGWTWINNDVVNVLAGLFGGMTAYLFFQTV